MPISLIERLTEEDLKYIKEVGIENMSPMYWTHPDVLEMMLKEELEKEE